jgi:hypothetical protein
VKRTEEKIARISDALKIIERIRVKLMKKREHTFRRIEFLGDLSCGGEGSLVADRADVSADTGNTSDISGSLGLGNSGLNSNNTISSGK